MTTNLPNMLTSQHGFGRLKVEAGDTRRIGDTMALATIRRDEVGAIGRYSGVGVNGPYEFEFYLTPCCGADATGVCITASNPAGVACRACYQPIDPALAGRPAPAHRRGELE